MDVVGLAGKQNGMVEWLENLRGRGRIEGFAGDSWRKFGNLRLGEKKKLFKKSSGYCSCLLYTKVVFFFNFESKENIK